MFLTGLVNLLFEHLHFLTLPCLCESFIIIIRTYLTKMMSKDLSNRKRLLKNILAKGSKYFFKY